VFKGLNRGATGTGECTAYYGKSEKGRQNLYCTRTVLRSSLDWTGVMLLICWRRRTSLTRTD